MFDLDSLSLEKHSRMNVFDLPTKTAEAIKANEAR
jgi:hypothetical protein